MKYSEFSDELQTTLQKDLSDINRETRQIMLDAGRETVRFLLLVNTGSAITLLTYMGNSEIVRQVIAVWVALCIFCFGIALVGVLLCYSFLTVRKIMLDLAVDTKSFFSNTITLTELNQRRPAIKAPQIPPLLGGLSFACFLAGVITAIGGLFPIVRNAYGPGSTAISIAPSGHAESKPDQAKHLIPSADQKNSSSSSEALILSTPKQTAAAESSKSSP